MTETVYDYGGARLLWRARASWPQEGSPTTAVWVEPPYGDPVALTFTQAISGGRLGLWEETWVVPAGLPSQDTAVHFTAVDEDNLSGDGEVGLAIRNAPPAPHILLPPEGILTGERVWLSGRVESIESLTVTVRVVEDGEDGPGSGVAAYAVELRNCKRITYDFACWWGSIRCVAFWGKLVPSFANRPVIPSERRCDDLGQR